MLDHIVYCNIVVYNMVKLHITNQITVHRIPRDLKRGNDDAAKIQNDERQEKRCLIIVSVRTIQKHARLNRSRLTKKHFNVSPTL